MAKQMTPMTQRKVKVYFEDYRKAFPDWEVKHNITLVRTNGPIEQCIAFQGLTAGSYRPSCIVHVLIAPNPTSILYQFLDKRNEQVFPREHATKWPQAVKAMEEQFQPPI